MFVACPQSRWSRAAASAACALAVAAPPAAAQQSGACAADSGLAALIQTVTDRTTRVPLAGAVVIASWRDRIDREIRVRTDSAGIAFICAPPDLLINLRVSYFDVRANSERARLTLAHPTTHTYAVDVPGAFVRGSVLDGETATPVLAAVVRIDNTPLRTTTDGEGRFNFERVPVGDYTLRVEHISHAQLATPLRVRGDDLDATVRLAPDAIPLQPITVTAFSRRLDRVGFYDRQKRGVGTFIGRRQIDVMNVQSASDLLRGIPGVRLVPQVNRQNAPRNLTLGRNSCRYRFIVDGARTLADFEMDFISAQAIEGIEVYKGIAQVPALFRSITSSEGGAQICGVVAIWTRDSR